jgi:hypothetical protein
VAKLVPEQAEVPRCFTGLSLASPRAQLTAYLFFGNFIKTQTHCYYCCWIDSRAASRFTPSPSYSRQDMEAATGPGERSELEADVFACIMPAIDATRGIYERERGYRYAPEESNLECGLAKLLSGLGSMKLMWPLPQDAFDAGILLLMKRVFKDLEGVHESLYHSARHDSEWILRGFQLAFEAVVDVATM